MAALTRPAIQPVSPTGRIAWSSRLVREWAANAYPTVEPFFELRLGPTQAHLLNVSVTPAFEAMLRLLNWYADAVIVLPQEILVIECKMQPSPSAVGQVLFYTRLIFSTPALAGQQFKSIRPVALFAEDDSAVTPWARGLGVTVEIYTPPWIESYLAAVQFRNRAQTSPTV